MRLHLEKMQTAGVGVTGLMNGLNLTLEEVMNAKSVHGVEVEGDDVLLDAQRLLPPPAIRGKVHGVRVEPKALVQIFGGEAPTSILRQQEPPGGYMYFLGSELNFGFASARLNFAAATPSTFTESICRSRWKSRLKRESPWVALAVIVVSVPVAKVLATGT